LSCSWSFGSSFFSLAFFWSFSISSWAFFRSPLASACSKSLAGPSFWLLEPLERLGLLALALLQALLGRGDLLLPLPHLLRLVLVRLFLVVLGVELFQLGLQLPQLFRPGGALDRGLDKRPRGGRLGGGGLVVRLGLVVVLLRSAAGQVGEDRRRVQGQDGDGRRLGRQEQGPPADPHRELAADRDPLQSGVGVRQQGLTGRRRLVAGGQAQSRGNAFLQVEPLVDGEARGQAARGGPEDGPDREDGSDSRGGRQEGPLQVTRGAR
jgi:hypothetical protein